MPGLGDTDIWWVKQTWDQLTGGYSVAREIDINQITALKYWNWWVCNKVVCPSHGGWGRQHGCDVELRYQELTTWKWKGKSIFKSMCKGLVVRGNTAASRDGEKASVPGISGAQGHEGWGVTEPGYAGPWFKVGLFPKSVIKSDLLLRKIFWLLHTKLF